MSLDADVRNHLREGFSRAQVRELLSSRHDLRALDKALANYAEPAKVQEHLALQRVLIALVLVAGGLKSISSALLAAELGAPPALFAILLVGALFLPSVLAWMVWTTRYHGYVATAVLVAAGAGRSVSAYFSGEAAWWLAAIDVAFALSIAIPAFYLAKALFPHRDAAGARAATSP